jgi:hypothetical protein
MTVMPRESWTDERLDDLNRKVDVGFGETRGEFRALRQETRKDSALVHQELGAIHRAIHQFAFAMIGTVLLGFMGTIAALVSLT